MERVKNTSPQLENKGGQQKSTFDRTTAFANYKLFGLANYRRPVLLAPRQFPTERCVLRYARRIDTARAIAFRSFIPQSRRKGLLEVNRGGSVA